MTSHTSISLQATKTECCHYNQQICLTELRALALDGCEETGCSALACLTSPRRALP